MGRLGIKPLAGLQPIQVRNLLRYCFGPAPFYAHRAAHHLRCDLPKALRVLEAMRRARLVRRAGVDGDGDIRWEETRKGATIRCARALPRMKRATAERLLAGILERAHEANRTGTFLEYVAEVRVYGSYLDRKVERLGDLDVAWERVKRPGCTARDFAADAFRPGRDRLERFLRGRSGYVSLAPLSCLAPRTRTKRVLAAREGDVARFRRPREL